MAPQDAVDLTRQAILLALLIGSPVLVVGMAIGLIVGLLQALTQVQDQTIAFVPKILAMLAMLSLCLPWIVEKLMQYSTDLIADVPRVIAGG
ncbi:MAG: flagellar biosynthetic protein FliQ [Planctomycetales bacterium]|nr:flagellar biosynthetic protein FliQ [Planctomycetales bacterium]